MSLISIMAWRRSAMGAFMGAVVPRVCWICILIGAGGLAAWGQGASNPGTIPVTTPATTIVATPVTTPVVPVNPDIVVITPVVPVNPEITGGGTVELGQAVVLTSNPIVVSTITVTSLPVPAWPFTFQWSKDGVELAGATEQAYRIAAAGPGDAGNYSVAIRSATDLRIFTTSLSVKPGAAPSMTEPPAMDGSNIAGNTITFTFVATGSYPRTQQWRKNGVDIPGATGAKLVLASIRDTDASAYDVRVENAFGHATSPAATLTVFPAQPLVVNQTFYPRDGTYPEGAPFAPLLGPIVISGSSPVAYQWFKDGVAVPGATDSSLQLRNLALSDTGKYRVQLTNAAGSVFSREATLTVNLSDTIRIMTQPVCHGVTPGAEFTLSARVSAMPTALAYQWRKNGAVLPGATQATLLLPSAGAADVGIYWLDIASAGQTARSNLVIVGLADDQVFSVAAAQSAVAPAKIIGMAQEVASDIHHPNGNVYDQVLLNGPAAAVRADPGQTVRLSYVDMNDDIVQLEFSGAGILSVSLAGASGPAAPKNYAQADVAYMKGHATVVIAGADRTTNFSAFSVGRLNAVNAALFPEGVVYDAVADLAVVAVSSRTGSFGGIRGADASFWATQGVTGIYAPNVSVEGPVYLCDLAARDEAEPMLTFGSVASLWVTGGALAQPNGKRIKGSGIGSFEFKDGTKSDGAFMPAQRFRVVDSSGDLIVFPVR